MIASKRSKKMYRKKLLEDARFIDRVSEKWGRTFFTSMEIRLRKKRKKLD